MLPTELDTNSLEGLARLFWFAVETQGENDRTAAALALRARLGLTGHEPRLRGAFEDAVRHLESMGPAQRFEAICSMIAGALKDDEKLADSLADEILMIACDRRIVRYSFAPSVLPCLRHAQAIRRTQTKRHLGYDIRYAGIGTDRALMASLSLYLDLPIHIEAGPPWAPDLFFDSVEPVVEAPELQISFPPASFDASTARDLEAGIRKRKLPRAIDRGKYDLESVMLAYLGNTEAPALAMVSGDFLSSPKHSRLWTRKHLLEMKCIHRIAELETERGRQYLISLWNSQLPTNQIEIMSTKDTQRFVGAAPRMYPVRSTSAFVSVDEILVAGCSLSPTRYLEKGPTGGANLVTRIQNKIEPSNYRLADLFEIIRPKTIRDDPVGAISIEEVRGVNISRFGEITGDLRNVRFRSSLKPRFEEQRLRRGDIVFAHRGPIGKVAYVSEQDLQDRDLWAGQTLFIFRERKRYTNARDLPYCDPRVLFMYLSTPKVLKAWQSVSSIGRSPSIPIGEVERFSIPKSLTSKRKPKRATSSRNQTAPSEEVVDMILEEFKRYHENRQEILEVEIRLHDGLDRVWSTAWRENAES